MKSVMKIHHLLSGGAPKLTIVHANTAIEQAKLEARIKTVQERIAADLARYGKATYTHPVQ